MSETTAIERLAEASESLIDAAEQFLDLTQVEKAQDIQYEVVNMPEWGGKMRLASSDADSASKFAEAIYSGKGIESMTSFIAQSFVDKDGNRLVKDKEQLALVSKMLSKKSAGAIDRLVDAAMRVNKIRMPGVSLSPKTQEAATAELKNASGEVAPATSPTESPVSVT